jgi:hypothetical protein
MLGDNKCFNTANAVFGAHVVHGLKDDVARSAFVAGVRVVGGDVSSRDS